MVFSGRVAVVTGANGNLGHTVVRTLIEQGAFVAAPVRDAAKGAELASSLGDGGEPAAPPHLMVDTADPGDRGAMDAFVDRVVRSWGRIDILANLAGGFGTGSALDLETIQELWSRNVRTVVAATAACLRPMRARGYGRVVTVGAYAALQGRKNGAGYAMAKGALIRWTESLAAEVKSEGITANVVLPTTIDHPANRANMPRADPATWVSPAELASVILFLCSEESSFVNGVEFFVDGGWTEGKGY